MWALAKMGYDNSRQLQGFLAALVTCVGGLQPPLPESRAQDLANLVWALAKLEPRVGPRCCTLLLDAVTPQFAQMIRDAGRQLAPQVGGRGTAQAGHCWALLLCA